MLSVWRGFLFLWVRGMGCVILLWHSLRPPYNYFTRKERYTKAVIINVLRIVEKKTTTYFWRAPGKPMRVAIDTDNSVNDIKCIRF